MTVSPTAIVTAGFVLKSLQRELPLGSGWQHWLQQERRRLGLPLCDMVPLQLVGETPHRFSALSAIN